MTLCCIRCWLFCVAALLITTSGLPESQVEERNTEKEVQVENELNVYSTSEELVRLWYPQLEKSDVYQTSPMLLAESVERILYSVLQKTLTEDEFLKVECMFTKQVVAGLKFLLEGAIPRIKEDVISLINYALHIYPDTTTIIEMFSVQEHHYADAFVKQMYLPGLKIVETFETNQGQSEALQLYREMDDFIHITYVHKMSAAMFVPHIVVYMHEWFINYKSQSDNQTHEDCKDLIRKLGEKLETETPKILQNLERDSLLSNMEITFGKNFTKHIDMCNKLVDLILNEIDKFKAPVNLLNQIHATIRNNSDSTHPSIRRVNSKVLKMILDKIIEGTRVDYHLDLAMYKLEKELTVQFNTSVKNVSLTQLETLTYKLREPFVEAMGECVDFKWIATTTSMSGIHFLDFTTSNVHTANVALKLWTIVNKFHPDLHTEDRINVFEQTANFLTDFYASKLMKYLGDIERMLGSDAPSRTVMVDLVYVLWDLQPKTLKDLIYQSIKVAFHELSMEVDCKKTIQGIDLHKKAAALLKDFLKSLEIKREDIPEQFYTSMHLDDSSKSEIEEFLLKDTQLEMAHIMEDVHMLMVELNCSTLNCFRDAYGNYFTEQLALLAYRHIQMIHRGVTPVQLPEQRSERIDQKSLDLFAWQHHIISSFSENYMHHFDLMWSDLESTGVHMCMVAPQLCQTFIPSK